MKIKTAMILAAGRGSRMQHLTNDCPKPLIRVLGKSLIGRIIEKINLYGIHNIVVNTCYLGDMIKQELQSIPDNTFIFSDEEVALETGGGVKKALPLLIAQGGEDGFFVSNSDPLWDEKTISVYNQLEEIWDPATTDALLALIPLERAYGAVKGGDYFMENGTPRRKREGETNIPYLFMGIQILHPRLFKNAPEGPFTLRDLYDEAQQKGRLKALIYDGRWFHVGTPEALEETEKMLSQKA